MVVYPTIRRRPGFTLVEVIVVMTILSILFALAAGAVMKVRSAADEANVRLELQQIAGAVDTFKQKYGVDYLPSKFVLKSKISDYDVEIASLTGTDPVSIARKKLLSNCKSFITTMFPRINTTQVIGEKNAAGAVVTAWTGGPASVELNGCECLVFFLGGKDGLDGFSTDPSNPWPAIGQRGAVSYEFNGQRLGQSPWNPSNTRIRVFYDPFFSGEPRSDQPYYYFTSHKSGDDYHHTDYVTTPSPNVFGIPKVNIAPFMDTKLRFHNPKGFQIISAGRDKRIGDFSLTQKPGTNPPEYYVFWENGTFTTVANPAVDVMDNISNFHGNKLGVPQ